MNFVDAHAPSQLIEKVGTDILKNKKTQIYITRNQSQHRHVIMSK